jgi:hypothetical protein
MRMAILKASGVTNWVTMRAIGQAVMKVSGQCGRNCGPALMKPMIPDMIKAIMKVMQSDRTNWVFLGKESLQQDGSWRRHVHLSTIPHIGVWCRWDAERRVPQQSYGAGIPTGHLLSAECE